MKVLDLIFAAGAFVTLKRVLETIIEGTERARLTFRPQCETPLVVESSDSLWVCRTRAAFRRSAFERIRITHVVELTVDIKVMHDFLRACKQCKRLKMSLDAPADLRDAPFVPAPRPSEAQLVLSEQSGTQAPVTLYHHPMDDIPRFESDLYESWPSFVIRSQELTNITLDLAVGGTEMTVTVLANGDIRLATEFDTGEIEHHGYHGENHSVFEVTRAPRTDAKSGKCIVKFLKLVCSLALLTKDAHVYVEPEGCVVVTLGAHEHLECQCSIRPYRGPRDVVVPEEYRSYALRIT